MHIISASKFRLGFSTTWNLVNSPLYFFNAFRLNLILNTYIFCILKFFRIRLVKWFLNVEARYIKLGIITFSSSKGNFSRIRKRKGKRKRRWSFFPVWNYTYIDQATRFTKKLYKYCSRAQHDRNTKWTLWLYDCAPQKRKVFPVVFYRLGKNKAKLKRKKTKWKLSLENIITSDRESDTIKKKHSYKSLKKFAQFPGLQLQNFLNFRVTFMLLKFSKNFFLNNNLIFKIKIFSFISYINLYIKRFSSSKKNKAVLRLIDWFKSKDFKFRKPGSRRLFVYPKNILFFDYFSHIKGLNDEYIATKNKFGKVKTIKPRNLQKLNMPWSTFFTSGLFMPYSYKRLIRKIFINIETKKTQFNETFQIKRDRILFIDYLVKFFVFDKLPASGHSSMKLTSMFFNRKNAIKRLKKIKFLLLPKTVYKYLYYQKNKINYIKYFNKLKLFKKSFKLRYSKFLLSGQLHSIWNNIGHYKRYITKPLTIRNFVRRVRRPFSKKFSSIKIFNNFYNKKFYKFFLVKYTKFITRNLLKIEIKQALKKKQMFNPNLISGSKNLKKYIEFFKVQKFFMGVYKSIFNKNLSLDKLKFNKVYFLILQNLIISVYNTLYIKFLMQLFIKLIRFNFIFLAYKKILSKSNNTNLINLLSIFNFGKTHVNSFPLVSAKKKFFLLKHKKKNLKKHKKKNLKKWKKLIFFNSKRWLKNIRKIKKYFKLHTWYFLKNYLKIFEFVKKKTIDNFIKKLKFLILVSYNLKTNLAKYREFKIKIILRSIFFLKNLTKPINIKIKLIKKNKNSYFAKANKIIKPIFKLKKKLAKKNVKKVVKKLKYLKNSKLNKTGKSYNNKKRSLLKKTKTVILPKLTHKKTKIFNNFLKPLKWNSTNNRVYDKFFNKKKNNKKNFYSKNIVHRKKKGVFRKKTKKHPIKKIKIKHVKKFLFRRYYRTANSRFNRYKTLKPKWRFKINKPKTKENLYYKAIKIPCKMSFSGWSAKAFEAHYWVVNKYMRPWRFKRVYHQLCRVIESKFKNIHSKKERIQKEQYILRKRRLHRNSIKIARNLGNQLRLRKVYNDYMFARNWKRKKNEDFDSNEYTSDIINKGAFIGFFFTRKKEKKINYNIGLSLNKNLFNVNNLTYYKNKYVFGLEGSQAVRSRWSIFNDYLKKKLKLDAQNLSFTENSYYVKSMSYKFFFNIFSKFYQKKRPLLWKIKKRIFFTKLLWWRSKYRFIKKKPEQRKKRRGSKKMKFRGKIVVRRDYNWRVRAPLTNYNIKSLVKTYDFYKKRRDALKKYLLNKKLKNNKLINFLYTYDMTFFRVPVVKLKQMRRPPFVRKLLKRSKYFMLPYKTSSIRKISWFKYWLFFTKMLNMYRKVIGSSLNHQFLRKAYFKSSLSFKLYRLKIIKYYIFKFYKFKYFSKLENKYLDLVKFLGLYVANFFEKDVKYIQNYFSKDVLKSVKNQFLITQWFSKLKINTLNSYITNILKFNIKPLWNTLDYKEGKLKFFSIKNKKLSNNINSNDLLNFIKSLFFFLSKVPNNFFLIYKDSLVTHSKFDFLADKKVKPKTSFKFINESRFIKFILSSNKDYSLVDVFSYKKLLSWKDFTIATKFIVFNNLTKFFKSTKLEKNFPAIHLLLKLYILWLTNKFLVKKPYFFNKINILEKYFYLKQNLLTGLLPQLVVGFSLNYMLNFNIKIWKNYAFSRRSHKFFKIWLKKKKFLFWLVQEFEKDLRKSVNIYLINSISAISKFLKPKNKFHRFYNRFFSVRGGKKKRWGQRIIFNDIMWTSLISLRYHCVSFLAENIAVQLRKRKKHWKYIHMMKRILTDTLPRYYFKYGMGEIYTIKVSINGKINGRNRTINHIFLKKIKDKQYPRTHQLYLYANYGFREVLSRYGLFAVKIWFFRV